MSPIGDWLAEAQQADFTGRQAQLDLFRVLLPLDRQKALSELGEDARQRVQSLILLNRLASLIVLGIHGIGGIGKSRLLAQFQALAEEYNEESDRLRRDEPILVARLDLQSHKGILDFLTAIYEQLSPRMEFPNFEAGLKLRQEIEDRLRKSEDIHKGALQTLGRGVRALIKGVPFLGEPIAEMLVSPEQIEAAISTIYGAVGRKEGDFWMKPEDDLTDRLIADLQPISEKYRFIFMFDTYERIGTLDEWVRERLLPRLGKRTLMVIAGRYSIEEIGWQKYSSLMWQLDLPLFSGNELREYLEKKGVTDTRVATRLADRTDGHPLILSMFAELAAHGKVTGIDLNRSAESKNVIQQLLKSIKERVAENLQTALEICAILRVTNEDSLAYMLDHHDPHDVASTFDQVRAFDFVKVRPNGIALHDTVWAAMNEELSWRSPAHYYTLNAKAAQFYKQALSQGTASDRDNYELEHLYHSIQMDEVEGIKLFQGIAEELVRYRLVSRLRILLNDVTDYFRFLDKENSRLWWEYYTGRLAHLETRFTEAMSVYERIGSNNNAEPKLQAYAFSDLGSCLSYRYQVVQPGGPERAIYAIERSLNIISEPDAKLIGGYIDKAVVYRANGQAEEALDALQLALQGFERLQDNYSLAITWGHMAEAQRVNGNWKASLSARHKSFETLSRLPNFLHLRGHVLGGLILASIGRYYELERNIREALAFRHSIGEPDSLGPLRDLGLVLGMQDRYTEANVCFTEYLTNARSLNMTELEDITAYRFWAIMLIRQGLHQEAASYLNKSLSISHTWKYRLADIEVFYWLGQLSEIQNDLNEASNHYQMGLEYSWVGRYYFIGGSLCGLLRVKCAQQQYDALPPFLAEAEQLAQQHEYNDHLASLRLTQGHIAWDGHIEDWGSGFEAALGYYKQALIYALRFNRFLLDEALSGRERGTPLRPIIPHCLERGEEGRKMLEALAEWWGTNDVGTPRPDTISPIKEEMPLLKAERKARDLEPGDGSPQRTILEQIKSALSKHNPAA